MLLIFLFTGLPSRSPERINKISVFVRLRCRYGVTVFALHFAQAKAGGEGGIRTPVGLSPKAVFKTAAIDHSATSPHLADWLAEPKLAALFRTFVSSPPSFHSRAAASLSLRCERRLARQEGLEPPTNGFGDRYSTN
jgi:hypothetical protein